jgi:glycosyltransferase involved in cell wall biosynthesis
MNIHFDSQIFLLQKYGGISRYFSKIIEIISGEDNCSIVTPGPLIHKNGYINDKNNYNGIYFPYIPSKLVKSLLYYNNMISNIYFRKRQPDILHETYYLKTNIKSSCLRVITIHDMIPELFPDLFLHDTLAMLKKSAINRADKIICVSKNTKNDLMNYYDIEQDKISVIHHGYKFKNLKNNKKIKPGLVSSPFLLFIGNRNLYKNFSLMLEAYSTSKMLKNNFKIIAFGGGKLNKIEKEFINSLKISGDKVKQINGDDNLLSTLYSNAAAFVFPSKYEGFGMPLLEAMAHGCPVICSNSGAMHEVANKAAKYFNPDSCSDLRTAIECIVYDNELKSILINRGIEQVKQFSWSKCVQKTLNVYRDKI